MSHVIQLFVLTVFLCLCLQDSGVDSFLWGWIRRSRNRAPHRRPHRQPHRQPHRRVIPQPTNGPLYRGCYRTGNLPGMIRVPVGANRPPVCIQTCKQKRYSFAGLQRDICYCMEQLDKTKRASEGSCGIRCRGATNRKCGHYQFMSVYGTGLNGVCECSASGDPHYYTFNRQAIHFQGICTYTLTKSTKPNDRCAFNVEVKNERRGGNTRVSYTKNIYITAHGDTIQFRKEKVYVNGIQRYLPYEKGNVYEIYKTGNNIRYQSNCLFHVEWNMVHAVTVNVPVSYRNKLTGICGKCNILRKRDDYMTKGGINVINKPNRYVLIGDSYAVNDPDRRCKTVKPPDVGTPALKAVATSRKGCGNMNPQNKANNPFRKCLERFRTLAKERFDSCVFDYCSTTQTHLRQKLICEALGDFAELCVRRGVKISAWRTPTFCPFKCKKNEVYKTSTTGCPTSCLKPTRKSKCSAPNSEGCECKPGYTLSGIHCVPNWKCGCKKNGLYYPIGSKVITCNEFISCERIGGKAKLHTTPRINSCPKFSKCTGYIQKDKCECIRDYEMKGNLCLPIRPKLCRCVASGDPHYYTYDEQVIHFQGICKYTLTKSLKQNDKCGFNVEVKNQNRGWNKKVSYTKDIYVTVNGDTISFIGNKIYINKLRVYLPFTGTSYKMARRPNGAVHFHVPDCHIYVIWNPKAASVTVSVPKTYANQMTGICGNCNGRKDDFKTKGGKDVSGKTNKYTLIGDSYLVKDVNGKGKCPSTEPPNMCTTRLNRLAKEKQNCGYLSFVYGHQNPFRKCIENNKNMAKIMYDSCVFDFCAYEKSNTLLREIMCKTLASFAELCEETGYLVNWRKPNFCPLKCGRNMVYSNSITACPASCADPFSRKTCKYPDTIGCKCKHGYMLSGDKCVKKCGCKNNGRYYPDGTILWSKDCSTKRICSKGSFYSPRILYKCHKNSKCVLTNGGYDCKCNKGYIKNGNECRLKRTECNTKADIVFLLDASGSVKKRNFRKMLTFVKDFTHKFNIGRNDMQIGINTFATTTKKAFNLKRYRNKADLIHAIGNVHYTRGWTFTGKALKYTRVNSFARTAGHRLGVPKIAIVMTDGKSTNTSSTETEAEKAHADGIKVFAVGIGNGPDNKELKKIASNPKSRRVIHIDNFILLTTIVGQLSTRACEAANNGEVTLCEGKKTSISCSRNEFIYIKSATYGRTNRKSCATRASGMRDTNCRASNTAAVVQKKCQGEKWCTLHAINSLFGDPCAGTRKYLHVRYTCKPDKKIRVIVCEGRKRRIRCPREKVISIVKAVYGRSNKWTCRRSSNQMKNTNCFARDSRSIVRKMCNGKPRCDLSAKNSVFKDPCYGTFKYLTVHFVCKRPRRRKLICEGQKSTISCRRNHVIYIKSAMYGRTNRNYCLRKPPHRVAFLSIRYPTLCIALKSRAIASKICNARHRCVLNASSRIFGDPCPRTRKYLSVQFKCIPFVRKPPVIVCERRRRTISCGVGLAIYITSAVYGRSSTMICRNRYLRVRNTKCAASGSLAIMQSKCNRKRSCRLQASNKVFGDPCLGTYKYLSVRYKCMPRYVIPVVPKSPPTPTTPPRPPTPPTPLSVCMLPHSKRGMCRGRRSMWSYNARTGKCVSFFYGGCGGNANRFGTEIECANKCKYKDCYKKRKDYQGRVSYTISGYKCQKWSSNFPHKHNYCFRSLPENYCRSPDSSSRPWCYTTDPKKRWEYCDVQKCGSVRRMDSVCNAKHSYNPPLCLGATRWGVSGTLMWSYNSQTGRCVPFNVRCGGGNKNKFKRRAQCSRRCLAKDCYHDAKGKNYKGFQSYTQSGYKCQHWILNYPHKHISKFNNLPQNYCRNPDSSKRPWCYTTNPKVRWEYCNVKRCSSRRSGKCKITRIVNKRMNRVKHIVVGTCKFVSVRRNGCPYKVNLYRKGSRNIAVVKLPNQRPYVLRSGIYTRRRKYGCVSIRLYNKALVLHQRIP